MRCKKIWLENNVNDYASAKVKRERAAKAKLHVEGTYYFLWVVGKRYIYDCGLKFLWPVLTDFFIDKKIGFYDV